MATAQPQLLTVPDGGGGFESVRLVVGDSETELITGGNALDVNTFFILICAALVRRRTPAAQCHTTHWTVLTTASKGGRARRRARVMMILAAQI